MRARSRRPGLLGLAVCLMICACTTPATVARDLRAWRLGDATPIENGPGLYGELVEAMGGVR